MSDHTINDDLDELLDPEPLTVDDLEALDDVEGLDEGPVLVDATVTASDAGLSRPDVRRDVIPAWVRSPAALRSAVGWALGHAWFVATFHLVRSPLYWSRLALRSPIGLWRVLRAVVRWVADVESAEARQALVHSVSSDSRGADALYRLRERHRQAVRTRFGFATVAALSVALCGLWGLSALPWYWTSPASALVVAVLGYAGRAPDRRVTDRAASNTAAPRLTSDLIVTALAALGLGKMNTALARDETGRAIAFVAPIMRDGPGWRAEIDLPPGVTAAEVIVRRAALASGLRRPLGCVWPEGDPLAHEGRLVLYVSDKSLSAAKPLAWSLAKAGKVNIFEPFEIGEDPRGRPVLVTLMFVCGLIGAIPRMGKTFLLRQLCLAAALDYRVELHIYNLKGGSDLDCMLHVAHAYRAGDDPEDIAAALKDLRDMRTEMRRRYRAMRLLPREVIPESKVTDEIAGHKSKGLHPMFLAADECQVWFDHPDHGEEFQDLCADLAKRGPAVGIMCWFATQRPDARSIPTRISDMAGLRFCLRVMSQAANDMVLGTSMYKSGYSATTFSQRDKGIAWFVGEGDEPVIVRTAYVDSVTADAIAQRARAVRSAQGWLTGVAAGQEPEPDTDTASILDHLLHIWPFPDDKAWCETLADRLAETLPGTYAGWTGEQVTAAVKPHGITTSQIKRRGSNRRGIALDDLTRTLANRTDPRQLVNLHTPGDDDEDQADDRPEAVADPTWGTATGSGPATTPATPFPQLPGPGSE